MSWYSFFVTTLGSTVDCSDEHDDDAVREERKDEGVNAELCEGEEASIAAMANLLNIMEVLIV